MVDTPLSAAGIAAGITDTGVAGRVTTTIVREGFEGSFNWVPAAVSAAGTTQGTATVLTSQFNVVTTVAAGTGVVATSGYTKIWNAGANALLVYPIGSAQLDTDGTNVAVSVAVGGVVEIIMTSSAQGYAR